MFTLGISLLVIGAVIIAGAFVFIAINMRRAFKDPFSMLGMGETSSKQKNSLGNFFHRHFGAWIAMILGGLVLFLGLILTFVSLVVK